MIATMVQLVGESADMNYRADWMVRMLVDHLLLVWSGRTPAFQIVRAPKVFFDLEEAGKPKSFRNLYFHYKKTAVSWDGTNTISMDNMTYALGYSYDSAQDHNGYFKVIADWTSYSADTAKEDFTDLCTNAGSKAGVVERHGYKTAMADNHECSFFASRGGVVGGFLQTIWMKLPNSQPATLACSQFSLPAPITCEWLARCSVNYDASDSIPYPQNLISSTCSPMSIIWLRMMKAWGGYEHHDWTVTYSFFAIDEFALLFDFLLKKAMTAGGVASTYFSAAGISVKDFKVICLQILSRWCNTWAVCGAGLYLADGSVDHNTWFHGTGNHAIEEELSILNFQCLEESLSRVYPYVIPGKKTMVVPLPIAITDPTPSAVSWDATGTWFFGTNSINYLTKLENSQGVAIEYSKTQAFSLMCVTWNELMRGLAGFLPVSTRREPSRFNAGSVVVHRYSTSFYARYMMKLTPVPDNEAERLYSTLLPFVYSVTDSTSIRSQLSSYLGATHFSSFPKDDANYWKFVASFITGAAHAAAAYGMDIGIVRDENEEARVQRSKSNNNNSSRKMRYDPDSTLIKQLMELRKDKKLGDAVFQYIFGADSMKGIKDEL
jgi:hypothetical protein